MAPISTSLAQMGEKLAQFSKQFDKAIAEAFKVPLSQLTSLQAELANFEIDHDK